MIEELWHLLLARGLVLLQFINNIHRRFGLWQLVTHWKAVLCAVLLCVLACFGGGRLYGKLKRQRLLTNANAALQRGEMRGAAVFAMKLLREDPNNLAALKVMTQVTDRNWPADALHWHQEIDNLQPGDFGNCLAWARAALRLGDGALARQVLDKIPPPDTNTADYQWLAGEIAVSQRDLETAAGHLAKAAALSPEKADYAFELAKVRLLLPGDSRELGRKQLETLAADPHLRLEALRTLFQDAVQNGQPARASDYFARMKQDPAITPADRMQFLDLLLHRNDRRLMAELREYQHTVQTPQDVAGLAFWMNANKMALIAIEWIVNLPPGIRSDNRVLLALGEAYVALPDWPRLKALTAKADWKDLDFLRAGLLARALSEEGDAQGAQNQWNIAILKAADDPKALVRLCAAAIDWGWRWETQAADLAWRVIDAPRPPVAILSAMQARFLAEGNTEQLYRLLVRWRELQPSDNAVLNNFALVSLLLKKNERQAAELAKKAHQENPGDARSGSTYAFSLYLQGNKTEALSVMSHFGEQLKIPSVALYYGLFLAACGEPAQARTYLRLARQARLLPEEEKLEAMAEASIGDSIPAPVKTMATPRG